MTGDRFTHVVVSWCVCVCICVGSVCIGPLCMWRGRVCACVYVCVAASVTRSQDSQEFRELAEKTRFCAPYLTITVKSLEFAVIFHQTG